MSNEPQGNKTRDYKYSQVVNFNDRLPDLVLKTQALQPILDSFKTNFGRIMNMLVFPFNSYLMGDRWRCAIAEASVALTGKHKPPKDEALAKADELGKRAHAEFIRLTSLPLDGHIRDREWSNLSEMSRGSLACQEGIEAALFSAIVLAWGAFEVIATDLWVEAVNLRPLSLGEKALLSPRMERSKSAPLTPAPQKNEKSHRGDQKSIRLDVLRKFRYNLSDKIGTMVRDSRRMEFGRLDGIRYAYGAVFGDKIKAVFKANEGVATTEALRNVIVHRGGNVDRGFQDRVKRHPVLSKLQLNQLVPISGTLVREHTNAAAHAGLALLRFVDEWLAANTAE